MTKLENYLDFVRKNSLQVDELELYRLYNWRLGVFLPIAYIYYNDLERLQKTDNLFSDIEGHYCPGQLFILIELARALPFDNYLEIGTFHGKSATIFAKYSKPTAKIHCVDTFKYSQNGKDFSPSYLDKFKENIKKYNVEDKIIIREMLSKDAAKLYENEFLDAIFIDGCHSFDSVLSDIRCWVPKLRKGGVIFGHDYPLPNKEGSEGVGYAVNGEIREKIDQFRNWGSFNGFWLAQKR